MWAAYHSFVLQDAETALDQQPDMPEGHLALGNYYYRVERDYAHALHELDKARRGIEVTWIDAEDRDALLKHPLATGAGTPS